MWQARQEELGRGVGQSRGGRSRAASHPAGGTSHRGGLAQPVNSANLATAKQKTGSQPGSWLWGWELWEEGPGPTGGNFSVKTLGTSPLSGQRDTGLWHFPRGSLGGGRTSLEP